MSEPILQLSTRQLLDGSAHYLIPMYQRNYAWEEAEISQLIQDVLDAMQDRGRSTKNYYLGSLVVDRRERAGTALFETLDGQQRLTTLSLLMLYLKKRLPTALDWLDAPRIEFENRPRSTDTFAAIAAAQGDADGTEGMPAEAINSGILAGYRLIRELVPRLLGDAVELSAFADYLFTHVQIMRVEVPVGTDLNHYFEVMNNRGEQLEKHEVLKARLLKVLEKEPAAQTCLHQVWEACANMEKYVQMGFGPVVRERLFINEGGLLNVERFDDLSALLAVADTHSDTLDQGVRLTLTSILEMPVSTSDKHKEEQDDGAPERFSSVINFPNFLLQVLQVWMGESGSVRLTLDDKQLLPAFEAHVLEGSDPDRVKGFVLALLRCKWLYDHYVIKREFHNATDGWSLKRFKYSDKRAISYVNTFGEDEEDIGINRSILMLSSALHVSAPSQVYKYWLTAALRYLYRQRDPVEAGEYLAALRMIACSFVFDRVLAAPEDKAGYYALIYANEETCREGVEQNQVLASRLTYGVIENNLVFNYLDYLLWEQKKGSDQKIRDFVFTFRSSVEHYYPQNPLSEQLRLPKSRVNAFGNLCLISHSKNSKLSNYMPKAKKDHYHQQGIDSIKQYLMMVSDNWGAKLTIENHEDEMLAVLRNSLVR
ncbi:DUF262 domain-containing protein [Pseudomonas sp. Irchel 3E13]|uniref:DUF262 domain-containing protein n=1 Tax=Pseudomonas sp. Irchel 3E13 TaxID=2008975 RepID=UPI000BA4D945|nr:DUF262 domain-containing protein [Pseudomonas sp. Irchel 3E13]